MNTDATITRLQNELRLQKARIRHWVEDVRHNLPPTLDSLHDAADQIDAALRETARERVA